MYRYLVLVWSPSDVQATQTADSLVRRLQADSLDWMCALDTRPTGLTVYHTDASPRANGAHALGAGRGVVLGTLFRSGGNGSDPPVVASLHDADRAAVLSSRGRALIDRFWGHYVGIIRSEPGETVWVLRDPSGGFPCFHTTYGGVHVVFSDLEDVLRLAPVPLSVNWAYVAALISQGMLQARDTGLGSVAEVTAGECMEIAGRSTKHVLYWDPLSIARSDVIEDAREAARALHDATQYCVHAWASCHENIVHRLSGGLDSAIVLSCLKDAPSQPSVTCLNYFTEGTKDDERTYARLAARRAGVELIEHRREVRSVRLHELLNASRSPRPWFYLYSCEFHKTEIELARHKGATGLFGGLAGDSIFYQSRADLAACDYIHAHGVRLSLLHVAMDAARVERASVGSILWRSLISARSAFDPLADAGRHRSSVVPEHVATDGGAERFTHPWLLNRPGMPKGKLWHVHSMANLPPYYDPFGAADEPESIYPLISQPLIELCLRIPTYVLISGGWDRAIARRAFAGRVPSEIIRRRAKGSSNEQTRRIFDAHIDFIRNVLLDGALVRERLLSREKLEQALRPARAIIDNAYLQIVISYLSIEAWLRRLAQA